MLVLGGRQRVVELIRSDHSVAIIVNLVHQGELLLLGYLQVDALKALSQLVEGNVTLTLNVKLSHQVLHVVIEAGEPLDALADDVENVVDVDLGLLDFNGLK